MFKDLASRNEEILIDLNTKELKNMLATGDKDFHFKWQSENGFIISLNFSFGSNVLFDANYPKTKSDIIAEGKIIELNDSESKIILRTKSKYWPIVILFLSILMLIVEWSFDLGIPFLFSLISLISLISLVFYIILVNILKSEDRRLLNRFKFYLNNSIE